MSPQLTRKDLKWLMDIAAESGVLNPDAENFILLIAQNHPDLFRQTRERVENGDFEPIFGDGKPMHFMRHHGDYRALLTDYQYNVLQNYKPHEFHFAMEKLQEFDPQFSARNGGAAPDFWISQLPNMRTGR